MSTYVTYRSVLCHPQVDNYVDKSGPGIGSFAYDCEFAGARGLPAVASSGSCRGQAFLRSLLADRARNIIMFRSKAGPHLRGQKSLTPATAQNCRPLWRTPSQRYPPASPVTRSSLSPPYRQKNRRLALQGQCLRSQMGLYRW